jgi:phosphoenolpyruvate synthase/pyruvate phosphate dikinase
MDDDVLSLGEIDQTQVAVAGGKGAQLGELSRIEGIHVPAGFCITTDAFRRMMANAPSMAEQLDRLSQMGIDDLGAIRLLSAEIRGTIEQVAIPDDLGTKVVRAIAQHGEHGAYAVRSSATSEDLPTASFAGQQDTYLNVVGSTAVLQHVRRCWASLFTERAVIYRLQNGFDHRLVQMAAVVQEMVFPRVAGMVFTADPVTSNRKVVCVEAGFGLGEALVSGLVSPDSYQVRDDVIVAKTVATKALAIQASPGGGTQELAIEPERQEEPALTDTQIVELAQLGRQIEAHFGRPQDIEWCLDEDGFHFVQSRPITSLFPVPAAGDSENHVYVSVGHGQMMTDAMRPLGLSFWQMTTPRPMAEAGGRLFVDVAPALGAPASRIGILGNFGRLEPLIGDALQAILERGDFIPMLPDPSPSVVPAGGGPDPIETDLAIVTELIERSEASVATLHRDIRNKSGSALLDLILADISELRRILFDPLSHEVFMSAMEASWWLNERLEEWLGEKNAADALTQSVPHNVTSEMGLALLDVADVIRPHPEVVAYLQEVEDEDFLELLPALDGGQAARDTIRTYLDRYGMRCVGEIDITRPRWSERPTTLVPLILGNVKNAEPGAGKRRFEQGRQKAWEKEQEVLARLRNLPDGESKADEAKQKIDRVRTFMGYREYPKYGMVSRYFIYKRAMLVDAERLVHAGVLSEKEDIFYLRFEELQDVVRTNLLDDQLIQERKDTFRSYETLTPPRVFTSEGEVVTGSYGRVDVPAGALAGLPVSAGIVEGRARVLHDMGEANLEPGDILVTVYTDPSWTPAFLAVTGLVTEVGGLMTHGAVIAREYGLPAVVGVEGATRLIRDGQRIRVNGTRGYVEILT